MDLPFERDCEEEPDRVPLEDDEAGDAPMRSARIRCSRYCFHILICCGVSMSYSARGRCFTPERIFCCSIGCRDAIARWRRLSACCAGGSV